MARDISFLFANDATPANDVQRTQERAAAIKTEAAQDLEGIETGRRTRAIDDVSFLFEEPAKPQAAPAVTTVAKPAAAQPEEEGYFKGVGTSIVESAKRILPTLQMATLQQILPPMPKSLMDKLTEPQRKEIEASQKREKEAQPTGEMGIVQKGVRGAVVSTAQMAPGIALSILTKNPTIALSAAGIQTGTDSYGNAISAGKSHEDAIKYASVDAAIEVGTELMPVGKLVDIFGSKNVSDLRKNLAGYVLGEVPGEQIATAAQSANAYLNGLDNELANAKTPLEIAKIQGERQVVTLISTLLTTGSLAGTTKAVEVTAKALDKRAADRAAREQPPAAPPPAPTVAEAQPAPVAPVGQPAATAEIPVKEQPITAVGQPSTTVVGEGVPAAEAVTTAAAMPEAPAVAAPEVTAAPAATAPAATAVSPEIQDMEQQLREQLVEVDRAAVVEQAKAAIAQPEALPEGINPQLSVPIQFGTDDTRYAAFETEDELSLYSLGALNARPKTKENVQLADTLRANLSEKLGIPDADLNTRAGAVYSTVKNGLAATQKGGVFTAPAGITAAPVTEVMQTAISQLNAQFGLPEGETMVIPEAPADPVRAKIAQTIKQAFGVDVVWANLDRGAVKTNKGRRIKFGINGFRVGGRDAIVIDANTFNMLNTLGHELTHVLETQYPAIYRTLVDLAKQKVSKKFQNTLRQEATVNGTLNNKLFESELVAEMIGEQAGQPKFWEDVFGAINDPTLGQQFLTAINQIIDRILNALQGYQPMVVQSRKDMIAVRDAATKAFQQWAAARQEQEQAAAQAQAVAQQQAAAAQPAVETARPKLVNPFLTPEALAETGLKPPKVPPSRSAQVNIGNKGRRFVTFAADLDKDLFELGAKLNKAMGRNATKADRDAAEARLVRFMAITGMNRADMRKVALDYRQSVVDGAKAVPEDGTYEATATRIGERRAPEERKVEERRQPERQRADEQVPEVRQDREQPPVQREEGAEAGGRDRVTEGGAQPQEVADEEGVVRELPLYSKQRPAPNAEFAQSVADEVGLTPDEFEATSLKFQTGKNKGDQFNTVTVGGLTETVFEIERIRRQAGLRRLDVDNAEDRQTISKLLAAEVVAAIRAGGAAQEWYNETISKTMGMASLKFPELADDREAQMAFRLSVAITSQGLNVEDNLKFAMSVYQDYRDNKTFPLRGQGKNGPAMVSNFKLANAMIEQMGVDKFSRFLETEFTTSEMNVMGFEISELADEKILGSSVFGPKIGFGFYSNLSGNFEPVTIDMWFMRTIGRLTGKLRAFDETLFKSQLGKFRASFAVGGVNGIYITSKGKDGNRLFDKDLVEQAVNDEDAAISLARLVVKAHEKDFKVNRKAYDSKDRVKSSLVNNATNMVKSLDKPKDAPSSGTERRNLREIVKTTVGIVEGIVGERVPPASMQALVWYPEQELYKSFGVKLRVTSQDYAGAIEKILKKEGYDGRRISAAAKSGSRRAQRLADEAVRREAEAAREGAGQPDGLQAARQLTTKERDRVLISRSIKRYRESGEATPRSYSGKSTGSGRRIRFLNSPVKAEYKPSIVFKNTMQAAGKPAPVMFELDDAPEAFQQAIRASKEASKFGAAVYVYDVADYANMRLFISEDGKSGFALKGNDIVSVFSGLKGAANSMLQLAVDEGGRKLDAFDTVLPEIYADNGFKVVARVNWNDEYSPEGWDKAAFSNFNNGEPDVVFMVYDPANASELGGEQVAAYEEGVSTQDTAIEAAPQLFSRVRNPQVDTPEFQSWFGNSQIVDENGDPMVMYHGTIPPVTGREEFLTEGISVFRRGTGGAIFVSADPDVAATYAGVNGSIYPLYVRAEKPFDYDNADNVSQVIEQWRKDNVTLPGSTRDRQVTDGLSNGSWRVIESNEIQDAIKAAGFDSYYVTEQGAKNLAVYEPTQLKSAVGNVGAFAPDRPEIQFSVARQGRKYWLPEFGRVNKIIRAVQNEVRRTAQVQRAVAEQGGVLTESTEIESAMHRMYGRAGNRLDRFRKDVVQPILDKAAEMNVDLADVELYLYAAHAKEANARVASINNQYPDGGSGMTNAEADQVMNDLRQDMPKFLRTKQIADQLQAITKLTQKVLVDGDIVSPADVAAWNATYKYYVPLKTFEQADELGKPTGNGRFDLAQAFAKRRTGRSTKAGAIAENILADYEDAVVAVERNSVRKAWLKFILDNKDSELWQVNKPVMQKAFYKNPVEEVRYRLTIQKDSETLPVRVGGQVYHMVIKDPEILEELQMTSVLSQFPATIKSVLNSLGSFNRVLSRLWTVMSPPFVLINSFRDLQTSLINTGVEQSFWSSAKLFATLPKAAYTVWRAEANNSWSGDLRRYYDMYREDGGKTGAMDLKSIEDRHTDLMDTYRQAQASIKNPRTYAALSKKYVRGIEDFMMDINGAIEGAARLAAYKVAMENGKSRIEATNIAKEITVNFNRRGRWTPVLSGLYLFFNPAVQGATRTAKAVLSKRGAAAAGSLVALGMFIAAMASQAVGDDDEPYWDKPSMKPQKLKNLIFFGPNGETYSVPLPYGLGFFVNLGYAMYDLNRGVDPMKVATFMRDSAFIHFSPLGSVDNVATFLSPTLIDPALVLYSGEKENGQPLMPDDFTGVTPDAERYWNNTRDTLTQRATAWLYEVTGGKTGDAMIDVSPESVEYITSFVTGGAGTFIKDVIKTVDALANTGTASATEQNLIPVLKSFHRQPDGRYDSSAFYENVKEAEKAKMRYDKIMESTNEPKPAELRYAQSVEGLAALTSSADAYKRAISNLRSQDLDIQQDETLTREEKYEQRKEIAEQIRQYQVEFNRMFYEEARATKAAAAASEEEG